MDKRWLVTLCSLLASGGAAAAPVPLSVSRATEVEDLPAHADAVFIGRIGSKSYGLANRSHVVTQYAFESIEWLKGGIPGDEYVVVVEGGVLGRQRYRVSGFPEMEVGAEYLVFLEENGRYPVPFVGGARGVFEVEPREGACLVDASGFVLQWGARRRILRRPLSLSLPSSSQIHELISGSVALVNVDEFLEFVISRADASTVRPIETIVKGDFDAYRPG